MQDREYSGGWWRVLRLAAVAILLAAVPGVVLAGTPPPPSCQESALPNPPTCDATGINEDCSTAHSSGGVQCEASDQSFASQGTCNVDCDGAGDSASITCTNKLNERASCFCDTGQPAGSQAQAACSLDAPTLGGPAAATLSGFLVVSSFLTLRWRRRRKAAAL